MKPTHRRLTRSKKIAFSAVAFLLFFASVEVLLRVGAYFAYSRSPFFLFYGIQSQMADDDPEGHTAAHDGYFKFPPNRELRQYGMFKEPTPIRINSRGLRGKDFEVDKPQDTFRVVCLGESSTFGFYDRDDFTYPALLEGVLNRDGRLPRAEVVNAGMPHANSDNILAMLRNEVVTYDPDVVTLYFGYNDATYRMDANALERSLRWIHAHFAGYVALSKVVRAAGGSALHSRWAVNPSSASREYVESQAALQFRRFTSNVDEMLRIARERGFKVLFMTQGVNLVNRAHPERTKNYQEVTAAAQARLDASGRVNARECTHLIHSALMQEVERRVSPPDVLFVDNIAILNAHPEYYASYVHLTEEANAALAEAMADVIRPLARRDESMLAAGPAGREVER